jgi:hypothetical protein
MVRWRDLLRKATHSGSAQSVPPAATGARQTEQVGPTDPFGRGTRSGAGSGGVLAPPGRLGLAARPPLARPGVLPRALLLGRQLRPARTALGGLRFPGGSLQDGLGASAQGDRHPRLALRAPEPVLGRAPKPSTPAPPAATARATPLKSRLPPRPDLRRGSRVAAGPSAGLSAGGHLLPSKGRDKDFKRQRRGQAPGRCRRDRVSGASSLVCRRLRQRPLGRRDRQRAFMRPICELVHISGGRPVVGCG